MFEYKFFLNQRPEKKKMFLSQDMPTSQNRFKKSDLVKISLPCLALSLLLLLLLQTKQQQS